MLAPVCFMATVRPNLIIHEEKTNMSTQKITKKELTVKAVELNLKGAAKLRKADLIHAIQIAEGNSDCFARLSNCSVSPCLYRSECQA